MGKLIGDRTQAEILPRLRREGLRRDQKRLQRDHHQRLLACVERKQPALLDQRAGERLVEDPLRQPHVEGQAASFIAGLILGDERQRDVRASIGMFAQVLRGLADAVLRPRTRQTEDEFDRIVQWRRCLLRRAVVRRSQRDLGLRLGYAVIVLELVGERETAMRLSFRILRKRDRRRMVGDGLERPLWQ